MQDHFFVDSCEGALHDTRQPQWHQKPLRKLFKRHCASINTVAEFKATLRAGALAWPGGYPLYLICESGDTLHHSCARRHAAEHIREIREHDELRPVACEVNWEDSDMSCAHCNKAIESAYGDDDCGEI